mmetsp:Transcript_18714/g.21511  ORF Transcript_18714/g.21511 Transcript_18714/m.21511 type:complete len:217 (-) Transcript_18714:14-664(-)
MGGILSCFKPTYNPEEEKKQKMTDEDKAVLNLKKTNRTLLKQIEDMEKQAQQFWDKAKEEKKTKNDAKALSLMKRRKLYVSYLDGARGKQLMIEETLQRIKSAKTDVNVMKALQEGQDVIEDLRSKATVDDFDRILEQQKETKEQEDELRQMLADAGIDEDDVLEDIENLEAEIAGKELDKVPVNKNKIKNKEESEEEEDEEQERKQKEKKKKVAA